MPQVQQELPGLSGHEAQLGQWGRKAIKAMLASAFAGQKATRVTKATRVIPEPQVAAAFQEIAANPAQWARVGQRATRVIKATMEPLAPTVCPDLWAQSDRAAQQALLEPQGLWDLGDQWAPKATMVSVAPPAVVAYPAHRVNRVPWVHVDLLGRRAIKVIKAITDVAFAAPWAQLAPKAKLALWAKPAQWARAVQSAHADHRAKKAIWVRWDRAAKLARVDLLDSRVS